MRHGVGVDAIGNNVDGIALHDANGAVQSAALVPPAFHGMGVHADGQDVQVVAEGGEGRQVDGDAVVAAPVPVHDRAVEPEGGVGGDAVDLQLDMTALVGRIEAQGGAVPGDAPPAVALGPVRVSLDGLETDEIMGQTHVGPVGIIEAGGSCPPGLAGLGVIVGIVLAEDFGERDVALEEAPSLV
ncbi:hypothetical protein AZA_81404 [Nitrospirillum viridazoti Y2]|nr:hypothetical protein AZA_81404 [Nitrospirillum amazonense Y2]